MWTRKFNFYIQLHALNYLSIYRITSTKEAYVKKKATHATSSHTKVFPYMPHPNILKHLHTPANGYPILTSLKRI